MAILLALFGMQVVSGTVPARAVDEVGDAMPEPSSTPINDDDARYQRALEAMRHGDYAEAFCQWRPLAERGYAKAQFSLGWMYHNGYGLAIDNRKALVWWKKAANQGMANAAFALGLLFSNGDKDIDRDIALASRYFLQAARLKHSDARGMLTSLFKLYPRRMRAISSNWTDREWSLVGRLLRVRVERANLRAGPGLDQAVLRVLKKDVRVAELTRRSKWVEVYLGNQDLRGWIYASLLEPAALPGGRTLSTAREQAVEPHAAGANPVP